MAFRVEQDDSSERGPFGWYTYRIYDGDRLIARYEHDHRGDDNGIEFLSGSNDDWPFARLTDVLEGGGPEPLRLTVRAIAYLQQRGSRGINA